MKRSTLSISLIIIFAAYAIYVKISASPDAAPILDNKQTSVSSNTPSTPVDSLPVSKALPVATTTPPPAPVPPVSRGQYRDGAYTGNVEDAYYGNVQVKVSISNGKITDVQFLDYPHDRSTSARINSQAMPYLKQETIQAQSANVDIISGATATSEAFIQSLSSALSQAA